MPHSITSNRSKASRRKRVTYVDVQKKMKCKDTIQDTFLKPNRHDSIQTIPMPIFENKRKLVPAPPKGVSSKQAILHETSKRFKSLSDFTARGRSLSTVRFTLPARLTNEIILPKPSEIPKYLSKKQQVHPMEFENAPLANKGPLNLSFIQRTRLDAAIELEVTRRLEAIGYGEENEIERYAKSPSPSCIEEIPQNKASLRQKLTDIPVRSRSLSTVRLTLPARLGNEIMLPKPSAIPKYLSKKQLAHPMESENGSKEQDWMLPPSWRSPDAWRHALFPLKEALLTSLKSQKDIQTWDKCMGLRNCHSKTMCNSALSRKKVLQTIEKILMLKTRAMKVY